MGGQDDALARSARLASSVAHSAFRPEGASSVAGPGVRAVSPLGQLADALRRTQGQDKNDSKDKDEGRGHRKGPRRGCSAGLLNGLALAPTAHRQHQGAQAQPDHECLQHAAHHGIAATAPWRPTPLAVAKTSPADRIPAWGPRPGALGASTAFLSGGPNRITARRPRALSAFPGPIGHKQPQSVS
jgi:hypothetical protein